MPELVNNFGALTATSGTAAINNFALRFLATVQSVVVHDKRSADPEPTYSRLNTIMWFSFASGEYSGNVVIDLMRTTDNFDFTNSEPCSAIVLGTILHHLDVSLAPCYRSVAA